MTAYYNEIDPFAAEWLRELIKGGHIAPGEVDTRSIADVSPNDLSGFIQCHFFAGIGVWSHALRKAGWADGRPVWTGSCPCQSFSAAGKGAGFDDPRHLWPHFYRLIAERKPDTIFGEQVEAAIRHGWLDLVQADLEREGYAVGSVVFPAAGIGAPHIRSRLYWVADSSVVGVGAGDDGAIGNSAACRLADTMCDGAKHGPRCCVGEEAKIDRGDGSVQGERLRAREQGASIGVADTEPERQQQFKSATGKGAGVLNQENEQEERLQSVSGHGPTSLRLADSELPERWAINVNREDGRNGQDSGREEAHSEPRACGEVCGLADTGSTGPQGWGRVPECGDKQPFGERSMASNRLPSPNNNHWRDADWLFCRDGKWRPVEPGTFPLATGAPARVGRLRGYGNAICAPQSQAFIEAYLTIK